MVSQHPSGLQAPGPMWEPVRLSNPYERPGAPDPGPPPGTGAAGSGRATAGASRRSGGGSGARTASKSAPSKVSASKSAKPKPVDPVTARRAESARNMERVADLLRAERNRSPLARHLVGEIDRIARDGLDPMPTPKPAPKPDAARSMRFAGSVVR